MIKKKTTKKKTKKKAVIETVEVAEAAHTKKKAVATQDQWFHQVIKRLPDVGRYAVDCDYDTTPCTQECRESGDYCRCGRIVNARVQSVSVSSVLGSLTSRTNFQPKPSKIDGMFWTYCVDRILRAHKIWETHHWDPNIGGGYYGEELHGCSLEWPIQRDITESLNQLAVAKTMEDMLFILLKVEYGHILPELNDKKWSIKTIDRDLITVGQQDHYRRLDSQVVRDYEGYEFPCAVVLELGLDDHFPGRYRLIDGYHRLAATEGREQVLVLVGKHK